MDDLFARYSRWVSQHAVYAQQASVDLNTAHLVLHEMVGPSVLDVVAARDALARLYAVACEGGFSDVATIFYRSYEHACWLLMAWV